MDVEKIWKLICQAKWDTCYTPFRFRSLVVPDLPYYLSSKSCKIIVLYCYFYYLQLLCYVIFGSVNFMCLITFKVYIQACVHVSVFSRILYNSTFVMWYNVIEITQYKYANSVIWKLNGSFQSCDDGIKMILHSSSGKCCQFHLTRVTEVDVNFTFFHFVSCIYCGCWCVFFL